MSEGKSIPLTAIQSIGIHGFFNPKRMLCWKDICSNNTITVEICCRYGMNSETLHMIQPSLKLWIDTCGVNFKDVRHMTKWPLHPFRDLHGYIPDLIENKYDAELLHKLGIDYQILVNHNMTIEWMTMFKFSQKDWALLNFDPSTMTDGNIMLVFGVDRSTLEMVLASHKRVR
jgi:hypothetical protein